MAIKSFNLNNEAEKILEDNKIKKVFKSKSDFINSIIKNYNKDNLNIAIIDTPTVKETKKKLEQNTYKMTRKKIDLSEQIKRDLFKWLYKEFRRDEKTVELIKEYLNGCIIEARNLDNNDLVIWITSQLTLINEKRFDDLDVDIEKRENQLLFHLLLKKNYPSEVADKIIKRNLRMVKKEEQYGELK